MKSGRDNSSSRFGLSQRVTALITLVAFFLQSTLSFANTLASADVEAQLMSSPEFERADTQAKPLYVPATYLGEVTETGIQTVEEFYNRLTTENRASLGKPRFVPALIGRVNSLIPRYDYPRAVGTPFVQKRYIRSQIRDLLGRHLIDNTNTTMDTEAKQAAVLYENAFKYAVSSGARYGQNLTISRVAAPVNMIWPEKRIIHGEPVMVPVLYLTSTTVSQRKITEHQVELGGYVDVNSISLKGVDIAAVRDTYINTVNSLRLKGTAIVGTGNLTINTQGNIELLSGVISSTGNLEIGAHNLTSQTILYRFDENGVQGARYDRISSIGSQNGSVNITTTGNISIVGTQVYAGQTLTLDAGGSIYLGAQQLASSSTIAGGGWRGETSSIDYLQTTLTAGETLSLIAGGQIVIDAAELVSRRGHIEILAGLGVTIEEEMSSYQSHQIGKWSKRKKEVTEYQSIAIRSILDAGKGVRIHSDYGDVVLRATDIRTKDGARVSASNGSVQLLMAKENDYYSYYSKKKGSIRTTTITNGHNIDKPIYNTIVGGFAVETQQGLTVEYGRRDDLTLDQQIAELSKINGLQWMRDVRARNDVDWAEIELAYENWKTKDRSINPAVAAVVAVAVACVMGPGGLAVSGVFGSATTFATVAGNVFAAGVTTLTNQVAVAALSGNIDSPSELVDAVSTDEVLKSMATSLVTAGVMKGIQSVTASSGGSFFSVGTEFAEDFPNTTQFVQQAEQALVQATVNSGVSVLVYGGGSDEFKQQFVQSLKQYAIDELGAYMANEIGDRFGHAAEGDLPDLSGIDYARKYMLHAALGCAIGGATADANGDQSVDDGCANGAGGAVIGEAIAEAYASIRAEDYQEASTEMDGLLEDQESYIKDLQQRENLSDEQLRVRLAQLQSNYSTRMADLKAMGVNLAKFGAALSAFAAGADAAGVNVSAATAENAADNNALFLLAVPLIIKAIDVAITISDLIDAFKEIEAEYAKSETAGNAALLNYLKDKASDKLLDALIPGGATLRKSGKLMMEHVDDLHISSADSLVDVAQKKGIVDAEQAEHVLDRAKPIVKPALGFKVGANGLVKVGAYEVDPKWIDSAGNLYWIDPKNGERKVLDSNVTIDHVLPRDYFKNNIEGWENVPKDLQKALINDSANLQPMLRSANSSKKARVELPENPPPFSTWGQQDVDAQYRAQLLDTQEKMRDRARKLADQYSR